MTADNDKIIQAALDCHLLNYIDNETPRRLFISGSAELDEVVAFATEVRRMTLEEAAVEMEGILIDPELLRNLSNEVAATIRALKGDKK